MHDLRAAEDTLQSLFRAYAAEGLADTDDLGHSDRIDLMWSALHARPELWSRVHKNDVVTLARWHQRLRRDGNGNTVMPRSPGPVRINYLYLGSGKPYVGDAGGAKAFLSAIQSALFRAIRPELDAGLRRAAEKRHMNGNHRRK